MEVEFYKDKDGRYPFRDWLEALKDQQGARKIKSRIALLRLGGLGDYKSAGGGVIELRLKGHGPGYRLYCGLSGEKLIILLVGGDKSSQDKDVKKAREYWNEYNS